MATSAGPPAGGGEASAVAPVAPPPAKLRPGRVWYWVALAVFLAGVAWGVVSLIAIVGRVDSFQRVPLPGTGVVSLTRGDYVIYYEGPGVSRGNVPGVPGMHIHMDSLFEWAADGDITMTRYHSWLNYQIGSHEDTAVLTLQIPVSGRYRVQSTSPEAPPGSYLAFGSNIAGLIVATVVPAAVLVLAGIVGAIMVAIIRHKRAKRARVPQLPQLLG